MTTPNVPLLKQTLAHIEQHPDRHDQHVYRCATGMCFAGWADDLDGGRWAFSPDGALSDYLTAVPDDNPNHVLTIDGRPVIAADLRAERILGLTSDQAEDLFDAHNTIDDLRNMIAELCEAAS